MPVTKEDFPKLVALQEHDKLLDGLRRTLRRIPEDIAAIRAEVEAEKTRLDAVHEKSNRLQLEKKSKENDLSQKEEGIKKHQFELNAVKTNEAFKALLKQIEEAKVSADDLETEILTMMDAADGIKREEMAVKTDLKAHQDQAQESVRVLDGRKTEAEKMLADELLKREQLSAGISAEVLELYDKTRERRGGVALAKLTGDTCSICHMQVPPQFIVNVIKGTLIETCDSCQRILYAPESVSIK